MVRPKTSRNGNSKRNRTSYQEEKINAKLRDYDVLADSLVANLEQIFNDKLEELSRAFKMEKNRLPKHVLQMRMGDLRLIGASTFADLDKITVEPPSDTMSSIGSSHSFMAGSSKGEKKQSRADEGYLTEDSATSSNRNSDLLSSAKARPYGPLASAMKNRRRSKSVSSSATPSKQQSSSSILFGIKSKKTFGGSQSLYASDSNRLSRSKFRTTGAGNRLQQTVSADRGIAIITPKVQANTPMAMIRRARLGESIFSITGSPVIPVGTIEEMANVNIPIQNGTLSVRPTAMDSIDTGLLQKIDPDTLEHLRMLHKNLDKIMQLAEVNNFQKK